MAVSSGSVKLRPEHARKSHRTKSGNLEPKFSLTVTAAARFLLKDIDHLTLDRAKARVSNAANRRKFLTNGKKGAARRIDEISFKAWRLDEREKNLDAEEGDSDE